MADYVKEYNLDKYKISTGWHEEEYYISKSTQQKIKIKSVLNEAQRKFLDENFDRVMEIDFNRQYLPVMMNSYFDKNIFYTFNILNPEKGYRIHKQMSESDVETTKKIMKEQGLPDIFIRHELKSSSIF